MPRLLFTGMHHHDVPFDHIFETINHAGNDVTALYFCHQYITSENIDAFIEALPTMNNSKIKTISFQSNKVLLTQITFNNLMAALPAHITTLMLNNNHISDFMVSQPLPPHIKELHLDKVVINQKNFVFLASKIVKKDHTLDFLSLKTNNMGSMGRRDFQKFMNDLKTQPYIKKIDLSDNDLENLGTAEAVANILLDSNKAFTLGNTAFEQEVRAIFNSSQILAFATPSLLHQSMFLNIRTEASAALYRDAIGEINHFLPKISHGS
ncbi:MAG: hypothetical protein P1U36_09830 [Legionellaceae bacterium]|nr:hypothetical protein [Legionellaceae bacterium]